MLFKKTFVFSPALDPFCLTLVDYDDDEQIAIDIVEVDRFPRA